ncbi:MAG: bacillithiol biosynthesis cysteine-adding enzyme BshC [Candidatus Hydrogenedentes bacterium]|nr:bacillithiol biosynthesis cysteine-adding enzyme BshC [Candidatus Hydrogenedentota bacterium]
MPLKRIDTAYLDGSEELLPFYNGFPESLFDWEPIEAFVHPDRLAELEAYQRRIGNDIPAMECTEVVTGQQPALLSGPLYTIYKIATTIRLAEHLGSKFGSRVTPIYWMGSDDHDFEEASTAHILTKKHEPLALTYKPASDIADMPLYRVPLEPALHTLIDHAADAAPGSDYRAEVQSFLHDSLDASESFSEWNARIIARLFRGMNLLIVTPELPEVRGYSQHVIEKEIQEPLISTRLVNEQGRRLQSLGFAPQIQKKDNECGFFVEVAGRRSKVTYDDGLFVVHTARSKYSQSEMLSMLQDEPLLFSPNVALRCIAQQLLFVPRAYIGGPGEISYWAQFKTLFEHFEVTMPTVYPRARCVLTTTKLAQLCAKFGLEPAHLAESAPEALLDSALRSAITDPELDRFRNRRKAILEELTSLSNELTKSVAASRDLAERVGGLLEKFESELLQRNETQADAVRRQITRLCNAFAPFRKPQERVYTIFSFLFEHGWDLIPRIVRGIDIETFGIDEIEL